ncbi:MAG TPA: Hsp20/alpha crystallin family protein [Acidimicrobiia bacterium]|nr:Hsp20/alpha crystallin family protein [Acidimicrobiia bacterium]
MVGLLKRETKAVEPFETFGWFDRVFEDWPRLFPLNRMVAFDTTPGGTIRVDEFRQDGTLVIRAELPGIDPAKDVDVTVSDGTLHIEARRTAEEETEEKGYVRRELRYGSFSRTIPLPEGLVTSDVTAAYKDGILEVRVPLPEVNPPRTIPVTTT